jgi:hypothetical protein
MRQLAFLLSAIPLLIAMGCSGEPDLPELADTSVFRAAERGAAAPDAAGLRRAVLAHAGGRRGPSGSLPTRICVDVLEDAEWLSRCGLPAFFVDLNKEEAVADLQECLKADAPSAVFVHSCAVMRWGDKSAEYELYSFILHGTSSASEPDHEYVSFTAVHSKQGWTVIGEEPREHCYSWVYQAQHTTIPSF